MYKNRPGEFQKSFRLKFSDGTTQGPFELKEAAEPEYFKFVPHMTSSVKIEILSHYNQQNNGANRILFFGGLLIPAMGELCAHHSWTSA